jgi:hypothetical protein
MNRRRRFDVAGLDTETAIGALCSACGMLVLDGLHGTRVTVDPVHLDVRSEIRCLSEGRATYSMEGMGILLGRNERNHKCFTGYPVFAVHRCGAWTNVVPPDSPVGHAPTPVDGDGDEEIPF